MRCIGTARLPKNRYAGQITGNYRIGLRAAGKRFWHFGERPGGLLFVLACGTSELVNKQAE